MTETKFRLLMGFFLCVAICMLTLSEINMAQAKDPDEQPACSQPRHERPEFDQPGEPGPMGRMPMPPQPPMAGMPPMPTPFNLKTVDLSEAQQDQVFTLTHEQIPDVRKQLITASKAMEALHQLTLKQPFDDTQAQTLANTQVGAMARVALMQAELEAKIRALLSPAQLQQLDSAKACHAHP